jgi:phospholipid/cholesterol/gamma-HCH transport system ATP-binding protein
VVAAPTITVENLHKQLDGKPVLQGVNLSASPGECLVILGRSGEGKSVLLKHIIGLFMPDQGRVLIGDLALSDLRRDELFALRRKVGYLFQGSALFDSLSVEENIGFALVEHRRAPRRSVRERVLALLAQVQLSTDVLPRYPSDLSGGMKRRVALARALACEPKVMLYDEPTTGIDPVTADAINNLICQVQREHQVTSILVTHDIASAWRVGNRVALLHGGRIIAEDSTQGIRSSADPAVRQFLDGLADGPLSTGSQEM